MTKEIILAIQRRITDEVHELQYIDRDWNQFGYEQPAVKYPCALIDLTNVEYRHMTNTLQRATATIAIHIANQRLIPASARAPRKDNAYQTIDIIEHIHRALNMFAGYPEDEVSERVPYSFSPLIRTSMVKEVVNSSYEMYTIYYKTTFDDPVFSVR